MSSKDQLDFVLLSLDGQTRNSVERYFSEAVFFAEVLRDGNPHLHKSQNLLEVGSGVGVLAILLAFEGFRVTAVEPNSAGFGEMSKHRDQILKNWPYPQPEIAWIDGSVSDDRISDEGYDFAYAIHVVEHVQDIREFLELVLRKLKPNGELRFICPNYILPYEPHLGIPTLFSKNATRKFLRLIRFRSDVVDFDEFWSELSWPTTRKIRRICKDLNAVCTFQRSATSHYFQRVNNDPIFMGRKARVETFFISLSAMVLGKVIGLIPKCLLPIIDCRVQPGRNLS